MTDSRSESDSTPSKQRGLWSLMGAPAPAEAGVEPDSKTPDSVPQSNDESGPASPNNEGEAAATPTAATVATADGDASPAPAPKQRGLWGMMGQAPAAPPAPPPVPADEVKQSAVVEARETEPPKPAFLQRDDVNESRRPAPRSLFDLMHRADEGSAGVPAKESKATTPNADEPSEMDVEPGTLGDDEDDLPTAASIRHSAAPHPTDDDDDDDDDEDDEEDDTNQDESAETSASRLSALTMEAIDPDELEPQRYRQAARQARRKGWFAIGCGLAAVAASALSVLPGFWVSLPASALGFIAIIAGYLALTGAGRREITGATRGLLLSGMLLGTVGIFLGPLLFAGIGRNLREFTGQQATKLHLQQMGEGLNRHYTQHEGYPIGGTFGRDETGVIRGQHGWMTFLLPSVGEADLYRQIDQAKPFDDPVNRDAMGRNVDVYFADGGDRSRIGLGFSVSHYAGLGGEINEANELAHVGIFERDVSVKRDEITDGLSNTLIVGELAGIYPPWGDPENWRTIGRGLNKDANGFGSYGGQGATFLKADGSVKFFSNKTDPKLLEKLSTRDGAEP